MNAHPHEEGWLRLGYAIIEQAVTDLRGLQQAGYVRGLKPQRYRRWRTKQRMGPAGAYSTPQRVRGLGHGKEAVALCEFFKPGGGCEVILHEMGAPISLNAIVARLGGGR